MHYILGVDIGTSACKVAAFDECGTTCASSTIPYKVFYPKPGYAEQSADDWYSAFCIGCSEIISAGINPAEIACIGIDGQSWSAIPVDITGTPLCNTPIWFDTRAAEVCEEIRSTIGEKMFFDVCGNPLQPSYTTPKVLWYKQNLPDMYRRIHKVMQSNSYIVLKLTGKYSQDLSQGYGLHFFDIRNGCYSAEMCSAMGLDISMFPETIYKCSDIVGCVNSEAAKLTGLLEGTPVIAGGLDAACGTLGSGVLYAGQTQEQGGTSGGMSICTDECITNELLITSQHVVHGKWILQGGTTGGGGALKWWNDNFGEYENSIVPKDMSVYKLYDDLAQKIPCGSDGLIMLPYMAGERSPIWDAKAKGMYFGIDYTKTKGHFIRALMEGVAFALKHNLQTDTRIKIDTLYATGGSANSRLWTQIKADVTGCRICVPTSDMGATLGVAMVAGVGIGMYRSFEEAVAKTITIKREHIPNPENNDIYEENYRKYITLYPAVKALY